MSLLVDEPGTIVAAPPDQLGIAPIPVELYQAWVQSGKTEELEPIELLEGYLVRKMGKIPPHSGTISLLQFELSCRLPPDHVPRIQDALTLADSVPEPDLVVACSHPRRYTDRHPTAQDCLLLIEVADTSLRRDLTLKRRIYARGGIARYLVVNLVDRRLEYFTEPLPSATPPAYAQTVVASEGGSLELQLGEAISITLPVASVLPDQGGKL